MKHEYTRYFIRVAEPIISIERILSGRGKRLYLAEQ